MYFSSISETKDSDVKYKNIFELNNDTYLIESNKGVKRFRNNSIDTIGDKNKEYKALIKYTPDALNYYYYYAIDNYVFNTK
jgi:tRNA(Glu) U13 pseudouridine synthase TruD